jgi:hypothetical protein
MAIDARDVMLGLASRGARAGMAVAQAGMRPVALAARAPVVGPRLRRTAEDLAREGVLLREEARAAAEVIVAGVIAAPEVERTLDVLLAGPLMDAAGRSIAEHRVVERVATQMVLTVDLDGLIDAVLDHELTERAIEHVLESPSLERFVAQVVDSRFADEVTEQVLASPELERIVAYIASSPHVVTAINKHTQSLAQEMVSDVRRRTHHVDDVAERTVRGWLRRPRPEAS